MAPTAAEWRGEVRDPDPGTAFVSVDGFFSFGDILPWDMIGFHYPYLSGAVSFYIF